tara:strand:- start:664 stop:1188 length:525 start_codon:yes stop_codon:yes gene_type:complete
MQKYKNFLEQNFVKRYRKSTVKSKKFLNYFFTHRDYLRKEILLKNIIIPHRKDKDDFTYNLLKKIYQNKEKKYKEVLHQFYKKFEFNLKLKKKYNKKFFKISNFETSIESYVFLGLSVNRQKYYNDLQKANLIIKIIDKISLLNSYFNFCEKKYLIKLLKIEQKLIKKIIYNVK